MIKHDRLKHLPPAAQVALVCIYKEDGGVLVKTRYVQKPHAGSARSVHPGSELWGIPYEVWKRHEGKGPIHLWEWHGTGEGMNGGPVKRQANFVFFGSMWEFPNQYSRAELLRYAEHLERWLADERYEFSPRCQAELEQKINMHRKLAVTEEWEAIDGIGRFRLSLSLKLSVALATCDDSEL